MIKVVLRSYIGWCGICHKETQHDGFRCKECGK